MASIDTKTKLERLDVVSIFCDSKKPSASSTGSHERGEEESGVKIKVLYSGSVDPVVLTLVGDDILPSYA